jgi:tRNA pseudouridine65 synthase
VLYQDEWLVAIRKPAGQMVHRSRMRSPERVFVLQTLRDHLKQRVYPIHRLDSKTSGVLLMALDSETAARLALQFRRREVSKTYLAVVRGWFRPPDGVIDRPLKPLPGTAERPAVTRYRTLATRELPIPLAPHPSSRYSLVEIIPETGRRQQIRRHFSGCAHPVIGDGSHGDRFHNRMFQETLKFDRLLLFATRLRFYHPWLEREITLDCPPDPDAAAFLRTLFPDYSPQ